MIKSANFLKILEISSPLWLPTSVWADFLELSLFRFFAFHTSSQYFSTGLLSTFSCFCEVGRGLPSCPRRHMIINSPFSGLCRCGCVGAFDPSSTSRAVRSSWGVCEGGGAPAWPGAAFWWCLFREHGLASVSLCVGGRLVGGWAFKPANWA